MNREKEELILKYINDNLQTVEKNKFYHLIINDKEFKREVTEEIKLKKRMQSMQIELKMETKSKIYNNIISSSEKDLLYNFNRIILNWVYQLTMPEMVLSVLK